MRDLLFLAHRVPYPPDRGDKIRAFNVLRHLAARARVHLVTFADTPADPAAAAGLDALVASARVVWRGKPTWRAGLEALATGRPVSLAAFDSPDLRAAVAGAMAGADIAAAYAFSSQMAQYLPAGVRAVMDFCDVDAAKFAQYAQDARGPKRWLLRREARILLAHDAAVARGVAAGLFVSAAEAALFRELTGIAGTVVENGIDTARFDPAAGFAPVAPRVPPIVFTGQMDYPPNVAAAEWLARDILPLVRRRHRAATCAIVGRAPTAAVRALAALPGVEVTGEVADVRGWLAAAAAVAAPLRLARGIQNKVLEAMAMARPVVASAAAAEGIDHAGTIRVGADAAGIADALCDLLDDPAAGAALGAAARARVIARYGWDARLAGLDALLGLSGDPRRAGPGPARTRAALGIAR